LPSSPEARAAAWADILDEFEEQLARADILTVELADDGVALLPGELSTLPVDIGPLPEPMRARALTVLSAQREAMSRLERLRSDLSRHIGVTRSASQRADVAVYFDRTA